MDKLFIIDGNSLMFRAFYGLPPLYTSQGIPCNAIFGFVKMLINIITKNSPKYMVVAFDAGKHNFRHDIFPDYKGTRKPMPDELYSQLPIIKDILTQMNICIIESLGVEADDIIGSLSKKYDIDTVLISADRDLLQLITPQCRVWLTQKGLTDVVDLDEEGLKEKYGIKPYQVIEMKSIMGDSSDNIPGVKGIGEKTALKLIQEYDNLDNIYANIDNINGKVKTLLIEQKDMAYISKTLATIKTDCELNYELQQFEYDFPFSENVRKIMNMLEFKAISQKDEYYLEEKNSEINSKCVKTQLENKEEKINILNILLNKDEIGVYLDNIGISFAFDEKEYQFLNFDFADEDICNLIKKIMNNININKIIFDTKDLMHKLEKYGIKINNFFDISIAYYLLGLTDKEIRLDLITSKESVDLNFPAIALIKLKNKCLIKLKELKMEDLYFNLELKLVPVLYEMESMGIKVDENAIKMLSQKYNDEQKNLAKEIYSLAGEEFNINSPKQMQAILFDKLHLQYKGKKSTNIDVLEAIQDQHEIVEKIIRYRKVAKITSTYLDGLLPYIKNGKIHTIFIQTATATGRLSSREPNLQNIPVRDEEGRELRKLFTSSFENGEIVSADYNQIELRLLAHFCQDKHLIESFNNHQDIHASTASRIFDVDLKLVSPKMRSMAKSVNFGIIYGISEYGLSKNVHISPKEAKEFIAKYFELYPAIKQYMDNNVKIAKEKGFASTLMGRIRYIPELNSNNYTMRQFGERVAMNMPLQGTASDIIKMAMVNVQNKLTSKNLKSKLILQIHDELIVDACEEEVEQVCKILKEEMENVVKLSVPLTVDVNYGKSWFDAK